MHAFTSYKLLARNTETTVNVPAHTWVYVFAFPSSPLPFEQDPYMVVKWGGQEVRTSAKRDSGKECSWPKEELVLIVRSKKQLQEPVEVEVSGYPRRGRPGRRKLPDACWGKRY